MSKNREVSIVLEPGPEIMDMLTKERLTASAREGDMSNIYDDHGQTFNRMYNRKHIHDRGIDELIGLSKGIVADGIVNQAEAEALVKWLKTNKHAMNDWPANMLLARTEEMLEDGVLDREERIELHDLLVSLGGGIAPGSAPENLATTLPLDQPAPKIVFRDQLFCFTGKCVSGTRKECQSLVRELGGLVTNKPNQKTNYVVIGDTGSRDWAHSAYGRKIEYAVEVREKGFPLAIIAEQQWAFAALP